MMVKINSVIFVGSRRKLQWLAAVGIGILGAGLALTQMPAGGQARDAAAPVAAAPVAAVPTNAAKTDTSSVVGIPIQFTLDKPQYVTLVIEDAKGIRVRNLVAETQFPAGDNLITWDGFDDKGVRVAPGSYALRGLTHDGIRVYYEFAYNTAGNPPWKTQDHSGGWMADHSLPNTAVFLPRGASPYGKGVAQMFLGGIVCEAGDPTIFTDLTGQKLYGNHYFGWEGTSAGARDVGANPKQNYVIYMLIGFQDQPLVIRGVASDGSTNNAIARIPTKGAVPREPANVGLAIAVYNSVAAVSVTMDNRIALIDLTNGQEIGTIQGTNPRGLAYDKNGDLFAIVNNKIHQYQLKSSNGQVTVGNDKVLVDSGIEAGYGLALDTMGRIYITDQGKSHQVKVFTATGAPLRTIGNPGGLQLGLYDEKRMQNPEGLAVDDKGQIWVTEFDAWPKRVSVWEAGTGKFIKGLYGPPAYGGGGTIDSEHPDRLFHAQYGGMTQWKLDWDKGEAKLHAITVRRSLQVDEKEAARWHQYLPERPMTVNGRTYLVNGYNGFLRWAGNHPIFLLDEKTQIAWPVAFVGTMRRWYSDGISRDPIQDIYDAYPVKEGENLETRYNDTIVRWADTNHNHKIDVSEFTFRSFPEYTYMRDGQKRRLSRKEVMQTRDDMGLNLTWGFTIAAPKFDAQGIPVYDLKTAKPMLPLTSTMGNNEEGDGIHTSPDGGLFYGLFDRVDAKNKPIWSYPVLSPPALPTKPGDVIEPVRLLGPMVKAQVGEAGDWYGVNGERGSMFLMTTDGLYIQTLGGHMSLHPLIRYPKATRGMLIDSPEDHISFEDEHFHPQITQTKDGKIYLCAGKEFSAIFRIDGFETIKRLPVRQLAITDEQLAKIPARRPDRTKSEFADVLPAVISSTPIKLDGKLDEWSPQTAWAELDSAASVAIATSGDSLVLAYKTGDPKIIENDGPDHQFMFKTGGGFDLQWRTDPGMAGARQLLDMDRRLLITNRKGKISAALFYPLADQSNPPANAVLYESPIGKVYFAKVEDVSSKVKVAQDGTGNFEVSIPLSLMELKPRPRMEVLADVGLIRGNGTQNLQRLYWHNRDTALVSDIPSEARLSPANWGRIKFVADANSHDGAILFEPNKAKLLGGGMFQMKEKPGKEFSLGFWASTNNFAQWDNVTVPAGKYDVELTYGSGNNAVNSFEINVGGKSVSGKVENTGGWENYRTVTVGQVQLTGGAVTVTIKPQGGIEGGGLFDFKELRLVPAK